MGFIEITQRYEELATFLGATADLSDQKAALCHEVNKFKATAAGGARAAMRSLAIYAPLGPIVRRASATGWVSQAGKDQVLNMLEELGMQIVHHNTTAGATGRK